MQIAIISDVHANQKALNAIIGDLKTHDEVWFLGDLFGRGDDPIQVQTSMNVVKPQVNLAGNHDLAVAGISEFLDDMNKGTEIGNNRNKVEEHRRILGRIFADELINIALERQTQCFKEVCGVGIWLAHGWPHAERVQAARIYDFQRIHYLESVQTMQEERQLAPKTCVWIVGHSHRQTAWLWQADRRSWSELVEGFGQDFHGHSRNNGVGSQKAVWNPREQDLLVLNPGSVGDSRDHGHINSVAHYLTLDFSENGHRIDIEFKRVGYA